MPHNCSAAEPAWGRTKRRRHPEKRFEAKRPHNTPKHLPPLETSLLGFKLWMLPKFVAAFQKRAGKVKRW